MSYVFISYSRQDKAYAEKLTADLLRRGFDVWLDTSALEPSRDWWREIERGVETCEAFVLVMSPAADQSHWVNNEVTLALEWHKPVFPLLLKERRDKRRQFTILGRIQWEDVTSGQLPPERYYGQLTRVVPRREQPGASVAPLPLVTTKPSIPRLGNRVKVLFGAGALAVLAIVVVALLIMSDILTVTSFPTASTTFDPEAEARRLETATADAWTNTPTATSTLFHTSTGTPDHTQTVEAVLTQHASETHIAQTITAAVPDTPTRTPSPTATPSPVPQQTSPPIPVMGSISGNFEIGGHVADLASASSYMRSSGMVWAKVQVRYSLGDDAGELATVINTSHSEGLRILLSVVGQADELESTPEDQYNAAFTSFTAGLAALGADAIEVWNEMNIDREWPKDRIDAAWYTRMLAASYNAIKASNPNTLVISGALAPTGAESAFPGQVVNDDRYYADMAAAGAAQYADCIGAHYIEGMVSPDRVDGDTRNSYPTRFLTTMTDRAWAPFGGVRPICYTALGYLTPEGYGQLPDGYEWAQDMTLEQQAAWLAHAAVVNSDSGKVRLMIIWNVNFTAWGTDTSGGYAIVRPGGDCPACETLRSVAG